MQQLKYILNPKSKVNYPGLPFLTDPKRAWVSVDRMAGQIEEIRLQILDDGRVIARKYEAPDDHETVLMRRGTPLRNKKGKVIGYEDNLNVLDKDGRPIPYIRHKSSYKERSAKRYHQAQAAQGDSNYPLFPANNAGRAHIYNSLDEAARFIDAITKDNRYVLYAPDMAPDRHRRAAERFLKRKMEKWNESGKPSTILKGDVPTISWYDRPYSDEDIDNMIMNPSMPPERLAAFHQYLMSRKPTKKRVEPYTDIPEVPRTVLRDLRLGIPRTITPVVKEVTPVNTGNMTEGFDYDAWNKRQTDTVSSNKLTEGFDYDTWVLNRA